MAKLSKSRNVIAVSVLLLLSGACASELPEVEAAPVTEAGNSATTETVASQTTLAPELTVNEIGPDGLAEPGEPVVLWFWSPD